jgi:hypothetical protein
VIIAILLFAFLLVGLVIGKRTRTVGQILSEEGIQPIAKAPNYHYIAQKEREIWGEAFHNDGAKLCECDACIAKRTPKYLGKTNHIGIAAAAYGYGIGLGDMVEDGYDYAPEEWRDHNGE